MAVQKTILPDGRIGSRNNTGRSYVRAGNASRFDTGKDTNKNTQEITHMNPMQKKAFVMGLFKRAAEHMAGQPDKEGAISKTAAEQNIRGMIKEALFPGNGRRMHAERDPEEIRYA